MKHQINNDTDNNGTSNYRREYQWAYEHQEEQ